MMSPFPRPARSGSIGNLKKANTRAAAQRLAQVMSHQPDDDEEDDDLSYEYTHSSGAGSIGFSAGRGRRPQSPMLLLAEDRCQEEEARAQQLIYRSKGTVTLS
ncbi:hypothetical protein SAY86_014888 [Trapa natans]|uniref:Uncharacterized protein n=1 Tax=Trapa natans TaxID=22666 RepID=A0AAN7KM24_TRANT|nr:hypothetical protein SAY86_014888 [Trapa natans]